MTTDKGKDALKDGDQGPREEVQNVLDTSVEVAEEIPSIPEGETTGVLIITKIQSNSDSRQRVGFTIPGILLNSPIEVGKYIKCAMGNSTDVTKIEKMTDDTYHITTTGGVYAFDPNKSL